MLKAIKKVFGGDGNERELRKLEPIVGEVNGFYETLVGSWPTTTSWADGSAASTSTAAAGEPT